MDAASQVLRRLTALRPPPLPPPPRSQSALERSLGAPAHAREQRRRGGLGGCAAPPPSEDGGCAGEVVVDGADGERGACAVGPEGHEALDVVSRLCRGGVEGCKVGRERGLAEQAGEHDGGAAGGHGSGLHHVEPAALVDPHVPEGGRAAAQHGDAAELVHLGGVLTAGPQGGGKGLGQAAHARDVAGGEVGRDHAVRLAGRAGLDSDPHDVSVAALRRAPNGDGVVGSEVAAQVDEVGDGPGVDLDDLHRGGPQSHGVRCTRRHVHVKVVRDHVGEGSLAVDDARGQAHVVQPRAVLAVRRGEQAERAPRPAAERVHGHALLLRDRDSRHVGATLGLALEVEKVHDPASVVGRHSDPRAGGGGGGAALRQERGGSGDAKGRAHWVRGGDSRFEGPL
mmetsp:Transcript_5362/g.22714  ORF Transcript_5362/g.22714 Transcript_5362/m.22714 type:complete len:397 (-) Transcript_5362:5-1195(-)